jgi:hypothetical protein
MTSSGAGVPGRSLLSWLRWRLTTWLLILWCGLMSAWIFAAAASLPRCPYGQSHCTRTPLYLSPEPLLWWSVAGLAGAIALAGLWWWDRGRQKSTLQVSPRPVRGGLLTLASLAGVLAGTQLLLFAPMTHKLFCATPIRLSHLRAYPLNCDSPAFMQLAHHPAQILLPGSLRQSRPGYVALSAVSVHVLGPAAKALGLDRAYGQSDSAYIPLVLINLVVLVAAVMIVAWLLARLGTPGIVNAALCLLLIINNVTKPFFWTPHQQMFVLLVPVGTIAIARWVLRARPSWPGVAALGFLLGLAALIYANALLAVWVVGLILLARGWRGFVLAVVLCASFAAPTVGWIVFCRVFIGSYFDKDVSRFHEFIWLPEAARRGLRSLHILLQVYGVVTARQLGSAAGFPLLVLAALAVASALAGITMAPVAAEERQILLPTVITIGCAIIFSFGIGIIATRIMYQVLPGILLLIGWVSARLAANTQATRWLVYLAIPLAALVYAGHVLTSYGPYS